MEHERILCWCRWNYWWVHLADLQSKKFSQCVAQKGGGMGETWNTYPFKVTSFHYAIAFFFVYSVNKLGGQMTEKIPRRRPYAIVHFFSLIIGPLWSWALYIIPTRPQQTLKCVNFSMFRFLISDWWIVNDGRREKKSQPLLRSDPLIFFSTRRSFLKNYPKWRWCNFLKWKSLELFFHLNFFSL